MAKIIIEFSESGLQIKYDGEVTMPERCWAAAALQAEYTTISLDRGLRRKQAEALQHMKDNGHDQKCIEETKELMDIMSNTPKVN